MTGDAPKTADAAAVAAAVAAAPGWRQADDGALVFEHRFASVAEAVGYLVAAWTYRDVALRLVTHDAGDRVTERDLALLEDLAALL